MKIRIALLFGGKTTEHEVSVISGIQALSWLDKDKYKITPIYLTKNNEMYIGNNIGKIQSYTDIPTLIKQSTRITLINIENNTFITTLNNQIKIPIDVAFPVVHGTNVEDGTIQGYLKMLNIPFVGSDVCASAIGMDKYNTKILLQKENIPVLKGKVFTSDDNTTEEIIEIIEREFKYPVIIKPNNLGSSIGVNIAHNKNDLFTGINNTFSYTNKILVETAVTNLREINCAVLGDSEKAIPSECEEPILQNDVLSYADKYTNNSKTKGMASASRKIPPDLDTKTIQKIKKLAIKSFQILNCTGVARIDFILDNNQIYFNEINTIPGSLSFYLFKPIGINEKELMDKLIQLALRKWRLNENLQFTFDTNILETAQLNGTKNE